MLIPNLYTVPDVLAASGYTEEQALQWGYSGGIVFMVLVPEIGACRVPELALSHFMAGVDDYIADGMPEHYSGSLSGPWTIKRDRLRILADSWEAFSKPWRQQAAIILAADARAIAEKAAKEGKVTLDALASEISQKLVVRDRGNEFADDSMGLTVAATRYKIGAPEQGLPGVRSLMLKMVEGEEIKALAVINNMPPVRVTDVSADNFAQWYLSQEDAAKVMAELLNKPQAAPVVSASDGLASLTTETAWSLVTSLERTPGYRWPLYQFLKDAYVAGKSCPKAQQVLDAWKLNPPSGLKVIRSGRRDALEYELSHGGKKVAELRAIQASIRSLLV